MRRWRAAWTRARRPLLAALVGGAIGVNAIGAQPPGTEAPPLAPPLTIGGPTPPDALPPNLPPVIAQAIPQTPPAPAQPAVVAPPGAAAPQVVMPPVPVGNTAPPVGMQMGMPMVEPSVGPAAPCDACAFDWLKVPWITPTPRLGGFLITPEGPGYYSLLDLLNGTYRNQAPPAPFGLYGLNPTSFFNYDFRYLDDPNYKLSDWSDGLKRIHPNEDWLVSTGGEIRYRYENERNALGTGIDNNFSLLRGRVYADVWYRDDFRVYVEGIYSQTFNQNLPQQLTDATGADILNAFVEAKVGCIAGSPLYLRVGRQELLYGSERLISTIDWNNTRQTFQGVKAYWHGEDLDVDAFWMQPVVPNADTFDSVDTDRNFFGVWTTMRPKPGTTLDLYYLGLTTATAPGAGDRETLGGRYAGDVCKRILYDAEGAVQFGESDGRHIFAQMATAGLGYHFINMPWNPQIWAYYDYASGDKDPTGPTDRTFNQLFGDGHYYLGYLDLVGRQNIRDLNFQFSYEPQPWITSLVQYHILKLDARQDALYDATGTAIRRDPTGLAGDDVGQEWDFVTNYHLTPHQDLILGYSKLFAGNFWRSTGPSSNPDLLYVQYNMRW